MKPTKLYLIINGYISRKIFHFLVGVALSFLAFSVDPHKQFWYALAGFLIIAGFETIRLKSEAKPYVNDAIHYILKRKERGRYNGVFWGSVGVLVASFYSAPLTMSYVFAVLAFADPAAALIGKYTSSKQIYKRKTVNGSIAFFLMAASVSFFYLSFIQHPYILLVATAFGVVLTLVEMFSDKLDDNFTIVVAASILMTFLL